MKLFYFLLLFTLTLYPESSEENQKREYAEFIVIDQKEDLRVCWYYTKLFEKKKNILLKAISDKLSDSTTKIIDLIFKELSDNIFSYQVEYRKLIVNIYMNYYTLKELKQLKKFFQSPLGAKYYQAQTDIQSEVYNKTDTVTQIIMNNFMIKLEPFLKKKELENILKGTEL
jgi:hypothetical protein